MQQVESITFDGTVSNPDPDQTQATIHVYGFPFVFDNTTNASTVCETVYNKFVEFVNDEKYFDLVTRKGLNGKFWKFVLLIQFRIRLLIKLNMEFRW